MNTKQAWTIEPANSDGLKRIVAGDTREEVGAVHTEHAALIAAAPELLEALQAVSASVLGAGSPYDLKTQKLVADALNKAEGSGK